VSVTNSRSARNDSSAKSAVEASGPIAVAAATAWQAVLSVELTPPETTDLLLVNPLGLYVTEINWTQTL